MAVSQEAKRAYDLYKKYKKAKEYYSTTKKLLDEDTRLEELFKLSLNQLMKLATKLLGESVEKQPYFKFHKAHLEILGKALTASETYEHAMKALNTAIKSADWAEVLTKQLEDLNERTKALKFYYDAKLSGSLELMRLNSAQAWKELMGTGQTGQSLSLWIADNIYEWRAEVCLLYLDAVDLLTMTDIEYRVATAAFARYKQKVQKLVQSKRTIDQVKGRQAEELHELMAIDRELDRQDDPSKPSPDAVFDPSKHAQLQRDKVDEVVQKLATLCDVAMSNDAYNPAIVRPKTVKV